jgi:uncharacterized flavoprotein (TIGR03862 family)
MGDQTATVIGGGSAGLIAAETLARAGVKVTVVDHKPSVGRKFLLAGRGGLNITHSEPLPDLIARYGASAQRLEPMIRRFGPDELRRWCDDLGEQTFVGSSGRVFPDSFRATPLLRAWLGRLAALDVDIVTGLRWTGWSDGGHRFVDRDGDERIIDSDVSVFALGGASWPRVGSDGGWVATFAAAGVEVAPLRAANVRVLVDWSEVFVGRFAGEPIKNVVLTVDDQTVRGDPIVTRLGLEGGPVYALTEPIRRRLDESGTCELLVDLRPDLSVEQLVDRLGRRRPKDSVSSWLRRSGGLHPVMAGLLREVTENVVPTEVGALASLIKRLPVTVSGTGSIDRAISSAGGVVWTELDEHLMLVGRPGTFVAGEMLDWEAPTGGYLLQASFSTGVVAAEGALAFLRR